MKEGRKREIRLFRQCYYHHIVQAALQTTENTASAINTITGTWEIKQDDYAEMMNSLDNYLETGVDDSKVTATLSSLGSMNAQPDMQTQENMKTTFEFIIDMANTNSLSTEQVTQVNGIMQDLVNDDSVATL